nr:hypothetical protein [uncultured Pedobacter sp.]
MIKKIFSVCLFSMVYLFGFGQVNSDQTNLKTSITDELAVYDESAKRFEIATVGYNSFHWQPGGIIIVELFRKYYGTGYEKYVIENGFNQGINSGVPKVKLIESAGVYHNARIVLGDAYDIGTTFSGYANHARAIYLDIQYYSRYYVKITYLQNRVDGVPDMNQIRINLNPAPQVISNFSSPVVPDADILTTGNVGIGITDADPNYRLSVKGKIRAQEIKVEMANWPDYVFDQDYKILGLQELDAYIKANKHLPDMPSAKRIESEGIAVGDMLKLQQKKIEELTLHLIDKDKLIRSLLERMEKVEIQIKKN